MTTQLQTANHTRADINCRIYKFEQVEDRDEWQEKDREIRANSAT